MFRSNGGDHNEPLRLASTLPALGELGTSNIWSQTYPAIFTSKGLSPTSPKFEGIELLPQQNMAEFQRRMAQLVKFDTESQKHFRGEAIGGLEERRSAFVPRRLTGPIQFVAKLADQWELNAADLTTILGFEQDDQAAVEELVAGRRSLRGRDVKDRIAALFRIWSLLNGLLRNPVAEREWMRTSRPEFEGKSPLDLLRHGSMEKLLTLRQFVEHISGL